ncbi:ZYRO0C06930p [Zygosaccharomyces rouxii]|uniref:ZYRO0C06930p n=1 Tax=Zygosaccharomyces rouxii (strain ATCC 2623 / CBS 732 / NBRC 1130 / NCYC 568 / NRRL Y-229) TaxID=559307 RepID=C5DTA8_ZYGRC|nr:uncharacterized protein ZYRO0C06930g [Zygosaccharomyces rouxii]KAH9201802.1 hypothetical protein LQ764DRAFT_223683 [Zygosaccharomyces rouxii]CAR27019.1 ZYRO0C06930p [Zygosaccharomyces rouxii]
MISTVGMTRIMPLMEKLESLLKDDKLNEWAVGTIDSDRVFVNSQASSESELIFCFVPLYNDPFLIVISNLIEQCKRQGFVDESVLQIQNYLHSRVGSILAFNWLEREIKFEVSVASLQVQLKAPVMATSPQLASRLFQKVLEYNLRKVSVLQGVSDDLLGLIDSKDKTIEYLSENVQELGGERIIAKWAPQGSYNAKSLERYSPPLELLQCLENSDDIMKVAESLLKLKPHFRNYTRSPSKSPRKRYRDLGATNLTSRLQQDQTQSTVLSPPDAQGPKRAVSDSPSKRQKFGKVKVTKK